MVRNNKGGHSMREGKVRGCRGARIVQRRISREQRAKEGGFFRRRAGYRSIRTKKGRKAGVTEVVGDIFG